MKKLLTSAVIFASLSGAAVADQITWDASWGASEQSGVNVTNIEEMVFAYNSQSVVTDNGDGVISVGDTIHSYGGLGPAGFNALPSGLHLLGLGGVNQNNVGSFSPNPFPTMDGYGSDYVFTFYFNDLMGTWDGSTFVYDSGTLHFGLESLDAVDTGLALGFHSLFDLNISTGGAENVGGQSKQVFNGTVNNFANGAGDDFSIINEGKEFTLAEWASFGDVNFSSNQTVTAGFAGFPSGGSSVVFSGAGASTIVAANHTGRLSINVPEPTSIAILGLGLLGFAGASRRKAK
jgi:hypothetical protein